MAATFPASSHSRSLLVVVLVALCASFLLLPLFSSRTLSDRGSTPPFATSSSDPAAALQLNLSQLIDSQQLIGSLVSQIAPVDVAVPSERLEARVKELLAAWDPTRVISPSTETGRKGRKAKKGRKKRGKSAQGGASANAAEGETASLSGASAEESPGELVQGGTELLPSAPPVPRAPHLVDCAERARQHREEWWAARPADGSLPPWAVVWRAREHASRDPSAYEMLPRRERAEDREEEEVERDGGEGGEDDEVKRGREAREKAHGGGSGAHAVTAAASGGAAAAAAGEAAETSSQQFSLSTDADVIAEGPFPPWVEGGEGGEGGNLPLTRLVQTHLWRLQFPANCSQPHVRCASPPPVPSSAHPPFRPSTLPPILPSAHPPFRPSSLPPILYPPSSPHLSRSPMQRALLSCPNAIPFPKPLSHQGRPLSSPPCHWRHLLPLPLSLPSSSHCPLFPVAFPSTNVHVCRFMYAAFERRRRDGFAKQLVYMAAALGQAVQQGRVLVARTYDRTQHAGCEGEANAQWHCYFLPETSDECRSFTSPPLYPLPLSPIPSLPRSTNPSGCPPPPAPSPHRRVKALSEQPASYVGPDPLIVTGRRVTEAPLEEWGEGEGDEGDSDVSAAENPTNQSPSTDILTNAGSEEAKSGRPGSAEEYFRAEVPRVWGEPWRDMVGRAEPPVMAGPGAPTPTTNPLSPPRPPNHISPQPPFSSPQAEAPVVASPGAPTPTTTPLSSPNLSPPPFFPPPRLKHLWWRAQALRFLLRAPSPYLCHVSNVIRHAEFGSMAARLAALGEAAVAQADVAEKDNSQQQQPEQKEVKQKRQQAQKQKQRAQRRRLALQAGRHWAANHNSSSASATTSMASHVTSATIDATEVVSSTAPAHTPSTTQDSPSSMENDLWRRHVAVWVPWPLVAVHVGRAGQDGVQAGVRRAVGALVAVRQQLPAARFVWLTADEQESHTPCPSIPSSSSFPHSLIIFPLCPSTAPLLPSATGAAGNNPWLNLAATPGWTWFYSHTPPSSSSSASAPAKQQQQQALQEVVGAAFTNVLVAQQADVFIGSTKSPRSYLIYALRCTAGKLQSSFLDMGL
ncbi:unnamed protein product [Closterium sp. Naga37s-1]|nr:unnamed protein product [Closterium sp. Naga37s-1]